LAATKTLPANVGAWQLLPRANAAACPQLAKSDFPPSSQHALEAEIDALQRQALALGAEPSTDVPPWFGMTGPTSRRNGEPRRFPTKV
jgi:hypothetical protein